MKSLFALFFVEKLFTLFVFVVVGCYWFGLVETGLVLFDLFEAGFVLFLLLLLFVVFVGSLDLLIRMILEMILYEANFGCM